MHSSGQLSLVLTVDKNPQKVSFENSHPKSVNKKKLRENWCNASLKNETIWGNFNHSVISFVYPCFVMSWTFSMKLQIRPPSEFLCKNIERGAHIWLGPHYPFISVICRMGFLGLWLQLWRIIGTCSTQSPSFGLFLPNTSTNSPDKFHFFFATLSSLFFW